MKKYVYLAIGVLLVVALLSAGTFTFWTGGEKSSPVVMNAGTISVDCTDGPFNYTGDFILKPDNGEDDFKPCYTGYITFNIKNTGGNPAVLWKHITMIEAAGELDKWVRYDLTVGGFDPVFIDSDEVMVNDVQCAWMPMGAIPEGETWKVTQSYHLDAKTPDIMQGKTIKFQIEVYAEQKMGPGPAQAGKKLFLDNKTGDPTWDYIIDDTWGLLDWNAGAANAKLRVNSLKAGTNYSLIYYTAWGSPVTVVSSFGTDGNGDATVAVNLPAFTGKVWVVESADITGTSLNKWPLSQPMLFEGNLVTIP